jgi:sugar lactone lactonase YvrE
VNANGTKQLVAPFPNSEFLHQMAFDKQDNLYIDAFPLGGGIGSIYKLTPTGQVSLWLQHQLLAAPLSGACPGTRRPFPEGAGGIAFDQQGDLYVANVNLALVAKIPVMNDGSAGAPSIFVGPNCSLLDGIDGLALDVNGNIYLANEYKNFVLRVDVASRAITTLVGPGPNMDSPHSLAFGTVGNDKMSLYFANFGGVTVVEGGSPTPNIMKIDVGIVGRNVPPS